MKPNEDFIRQAGQIIHGDFDGGTFYVMVADITNFHTVNHFTVRRQVMNCLGVWGTYLQGGRICVCAKGPLRIYFLGCSFWMMKQISGMSWAAAM